MALSRRPGPRPTTTPTNPHTQLDQQPAGSEQRDRLAAAVFALPGVVERPSAISVPGARALWLVEDAGGPPEAFMIGNEFAHLHPAPDQSLHAMLPPALAVEAIEAGWAEQHPVARRGLIPENAVMIYAPRDDWEREVVEGLVRASHAFARGRSRDAGAMTTRRIIYQGPVSLAVPTATRLADAEGVELTSSQMGSRGEGGDDVVRLTLVLDGPADAIAAALAATQDGLPPEATITIADSGGDTS